MSIFDRRKGILCHFHVVCLYRYNLLCSTLLIVVAASNIHSQMLPYVRKFMLICDSDMFAECGCGKGHMIGVSRRE